MTDYDITPAGASSPTVRLYGESLQPPRRTQRTQAERLGVVAGGAPDSTGEGLEPGDVRFRGYWLGTDAGTIADTFRTGIVDDPSVERVDVQAVDDSGSDVASRYNGTYRIADEARLEQPDPTTDAIWEYTITLIED